MPSKKPVIAVRTTEDINRKFERIAAEENRSMANLAEKLIKDYIKIYELQHGEIKTE